MSKSLVEIVHLCQNTNNDRDDENVSRWMGKLVVATESEFQCNTKSFDCTDRNRANCRTNRNVNHRVFGTKLRCNLDDHENGKCTNHEQVRQK